MITDIENYKQLIASCLIAGLGISCIHKMFKRDYKIKISEHELRKLINESRLLWATTPLEKTSDASNISDAIELKKISRKTFCRSPIPIPHYAEVIQIADSSSNYKSSLQKVNNYLVSNNVQTISYHSLCRFIRKMKGE